MELVEIIASQADGGLTEARQNVLRTVLTGNVLISHHVGSDGKHYEGSENIDIR